MVIDQSTSKQLGSETGESAIPPPTRAEPYPPLPLPVDDVYIHSTHIEQAPPHVVSSLIGFNTNIMVYRSCTPLYKAEMSYPLDEELPWERQKMVLNYCLQTVKHSLDDTPPELKVWPGSSTHALEQNQSYCPPMPDFTGVRDPGFLDSADVETNGEERRRVQHEIQKANIYGTFLSTRSYLLEKYWNLCEAHRQKLARERQRSANVGEIPLEPKRSPYDLTEEEMMIEREGIVKDLLMVLSSINQMNMEPNARSLVSYVPSTHVCVSTLTPL